MVCDRIKLMGRGLSSKKIKKPTEYISKSVLFFKRGFYVDERVHIPRKNTEPLVEEAIEFLNKQTRPLVVADIGTGAGVIAITLVLECKNVSKVFATDNFADALEVAKINIGKYGLNSKVVLRQGSLLEPIKGEKIDVIVANLPHASKEKLKSLRPEVREYEPLEGYYGGKTGLELYEQLFSQLRGSQEPDSLRAVFIKISPVHKEEIKSLHQKYLSEFQLKIKRDEEGKVRYALFIK